MKSPATKRSEVSLRELVGGRPLRFRVQAHARLITGKEPDEKIAALAAWASKDDANPALLVNDPLAACEQAGVKLTEHDRARAERALEALRRRELPANVDLEKVTVKVAETGRKPTRTKRGES